MRFPWRESSWCWESLSRGFFLRRKRFLRPFAASAPIDGLAAIASKYRRSIPTKLPADSRRFGRLGGAGNGLSILLRSAKKISSNCLPRIQPIGYNVRNVSIGLVSKRFSRCGEGRLAVEPRGCPASNPLETGRHFPVPRESTRGNTTGGPARVGIVRDLRAPTISTCAVHLLVIDFFQQQTAFAGVESVAIIRLDDS
jgi:hypothetical protein